MVCDKEPKRVKADMIIFWQHALVILKEQIQIHHHAQQNNVDILYHILSSRLNQRHRCFHMDARAYANEMLMRLDKFLDEHLSLICLMCMKEIILKLKIKL